MPVLIPSFIGSLFRSRALDTSGNSPTEAPKSPIQLYFDNLKLKDLIYDSGIRYADNLPSSQLPLKSHSFFDGARNLEYIFSLNYLPEEVEFFFSESDTIKEKEKEVLNLEQLSITYDPSEMSKTFGFNPYRIYDRRDVLFALEHGPIQSAQKLAALLNPDMADLHFTVLRRNPRLQAQGVDPMVLTCFNPLTNERNFVRCIVVPLTPWQFTSEDFAKFTQLGMFTESDDNIELMWSYVYDVCTIYECDYFIITTYENWAFGMFTHKYEQAFISQPISKNSKDSVMMYLTYWVLNCCFTTDTAVIQEVIQNELQYYLLRVTKTYSFLGYRLFTDEEHQIALVESERTMERPVTPDASGFIIGYDEENLSKDSDELEESESQEDANFSVESDDSSEDLESIVDTEEKGVSARLMEFLNILRPTAENSDAMLMDVELVPVSQDTIESDESARIPRENLTKNNNESQIYWAPEFWDDIEVE